MILHNISAFSVVLPLIAGVLFYSVFKTNIRLIYYFLMIALFQGLIIYLAENHINNLWVINLTFLLGSAYYSYVIIAGVFNSNLKLSLLILTYLISGLIINSYFGWYSLQRITYLSNNLCIILISLLGLIRLIKVDSKGMLFNYPITWFIVSSLLYYTCNILIFSSLDIGLLDSESQLTFIYTNIHPYINIFTNLVYTFAFIYPWKKQIFST